MRSKLAIACALATALAGGVAALDRAAPPDLTRLHGVSRVVEDRSGTPLRVFMSGDDKWRLPTRPADVDPLYLAMLTAYEDKRFAGHPGVDPLAILRAAGQAVAAGRFVSGASTLTMQAARLLEPRPRTLHSKFVEMARAIQLEARLGKAGVLEAYLTLAPFGGPVEGVRAASLKLFGHEPAMLTPAEAALLVALPQAPNERRPDLRPAAARAARADVLKRAVAAGVIDRMAADAAADAPLPDRYLDLPFAAPRVGRALMGARRGPAIRTTIDGGLQGRLERRLKAAMADFPAPTTAAAIIVDAATAEVRAIAGGPDFFDARRAGMLDMTEAVRSPGSALKPFVYALAFDRLLAHPATVIGDRPFREGGYAPTNFDVGYQGDVTVAAALAQSLNVPAVKMMRRVGPQRFVAAMATAGVELRFDREGGDAGLAIALGGVGIDLRTLARAYVALAGDGRMPDRLALTPEDRPRWRPFLGAEAAAWTRAALAIAPPPPGRALEGGVMPYKTGTSYGFRDALAVGMAGGHVIAVWVGRPDGGSCAGCIGRVAAGPILFDLADMLPGGAATTGRSVFGPAPFGPPPPHLDRFEGPAAGRPSAPTVSLRFPVDGAELRLGRRGSVSLEASGGVGPYRWLVDGAPVGRSGPGEALRWRPDGGGFHRVQAIDAAGASASARVFIAGGAG